MRKYLVLAAGLLIAVLLWVVLRPSVHAAMDLDVPVNSAVVQDYPPDPTSNIAWVGAGDSVAVVQEQFNLARSIENAQLGTFVPPLAMPTQAQWDAKDGGQKALWLINQERTARGLLPVDNVEKNVTEVAQAYAEWLLANNAWGHTEDGRDPWKRLDANPTIAACREFLGVAENLAFAATTSATPNRIALEKAFYSWMYDDAEHNWGHRHAILWTPYNDNSGTPGQEGFIGLGHARGAYVYPGDPTQFLWPNADMIVLNLFDPCATWAGSAPPTVQPPPTPRPVPTPVPTPNRASVSGQARLPTWITVENQPFEPSTWPGKWAVSDANGAQDGEYFWTIDNCKLDADSGVSSGMAVGGGTGGEAISACDEHYPNNVRSWMVFGPFSLADAIAAEMRAKVWVYTEPDVDMLCLLASTDMNNFNGPCIAGDSSNTDNPGGWADLLFDLNSVYRMGSLLGKGGLYVALAFVTDETVTEPHLGAFADNVILRKGVRGTAAASTEGDLGAAAASPLEGVRITDENGNWALTDADGSFRLVNLARGRHTLTPSKDGFQFYPPTIVVDLSRGDVTSVTFVGTSSIVERLYIPELLGSSPVTAASGAYTITDAAFRLECGDGGCTLVGPSASDNRQ